MERVPIASNATAQAILPQIDPDRRVIIDALTTGNLRYSAHAGLFWLSFAR
ncbi:MAG TPA: hypothetical protein VK086_06660 [Ruania sp.]|nr:hypothetical protein [Ruania sp.]